MLDVAMKGKGRGEARPVRTLGAERRRVESARMVAHARLHETSGGLRRKK